MTASPPRPSLPLKTPPQTAYPQCQFCRENEGDAGRMDHPAQTNHRIVPIEVCGDD